MTLLVRTALSKKEGFTSNFFLAHYFCVLFFIGLHASSISWITMKGYQILISHT